MLLQCDNCNAKVSALAKLPCGFELEKKEDQLYLCMATDESVYRNICLTCLHQM